MSAAVSSGTIAFPLSSNSGTFKLAIVDSVTKSSNCFGSSVIGLLEALNPRFFISRLVLAGSGIPALISGAVATGKGAGTTIGAPPPCIIGIPVFVPKATPLTKIGAVPSAGVPSIDIPACNTIAPSGPAPAVFTLT